MEVVASSNPYLAGQGTLNMTDAHAEEQIEEGEEVEAEADDPRIDDLVARVAAHDEALAAEVGELGERIDDAESELAERRSAVEELEERLQRERADFRNYKKRSEEREEQLKERATEDLVERLLDVRDNLVRALEQDEDVEIRDGVESTLATFDRVLESENVDAIEPDPGESVDPAVHEVVHRVPDAEREPGTIESVYRPGYTLAGDVLRPAQVTVVEAPDES